MFSYEFSKDMMLTIVEVKYHDKDNILQEKKLNFIDPSMAATYVMQLMFEYMCRKFRNYIIHALKISLGSKHPKYTDPKRIAVVEEMMVQVRSLNKTNLPMLAFYIRLKQEDLKMLLPAEENSSFKSSKRNVEELIYMANKLKPATSSSAKNHAL